MLLRVSWCSNHTFNDGNCPDVVVSYSSGIGVRLDWFRMGKCTKYINNVNKKRLRACAQSATQRLSTLGCVSDYQSNEWFIVRKLQKVIWSPISALHMYISPNPHDSHRVPLNIRLSDCDYRGITRFPKRISTRVVCPRMGAYGRRDKHLLG